MQKDNQPSDSSRESDASDSDDRNSLFNFDSETANKEQYDNHIRDLQTEIEHLNADKMEQNDLNDQIIEGLTEKNDRIREQLKTIISRGDPESSEIESQDVLLIKIEKVMTQREKSILDLQSELETRAGLFKKQLNYYVTNEQTNQKRNEDLKIKNHKFVYKLGQLTKINNQLQKKINLTNFSLSPKPAKKKTMQVEQEQIKNFLKKRVESLTNQNQNIKSELVMKDQELRALQDVEEQNQELTLTIKQLGDENKTLVEKIETVELKITTVEKLKQAQEKILIRKKNEGDGESQKVIEENNQMKARIQKLTNDRLQMQHQKNQSLALHHAEKNKLNERVQELINKFNKLEEGFGEKEQELRALQDVEEQNQELTLTIKQLGEQINSFKRDQTSQNLTNEIKQLKYTLKSQKIEYASLEKVNITQEEQIQNLKEINQDQVKKHKKFRAEIEKEQRTLEKTFEDLKIEHSSQTKGQQSEIDKLVKKFNNENQRNIQTMVSVQKLQQQNSDHLEKITGLNEKIKSDKKEQVSQKKIIEEFTQKIRKSTKEFVDYKNKSKTSGNLKLKQSEEKVKELGKQVGVQKEEMDDLREEISGLKQDIKELVEQRKETDKKYYQKESVAIQLKAKLEKTEKLLKKLEQSEETATKNHQVMELELRKKIEKLEINNQDETTDECLKKTLQELSLTRSQSVQKEETNKKKFLIVEKQLNEKTNQIDQIYLTFDVEIGQLKQQISEKNIEINNFRKEQKLTKKMIANQHKQLDKEIQEERLKIRKSLEAIHNEQMENAKKKLKDLEKNFDVQMGKMKFEMKKLRKEVNKSNESSKKPDKSSQKEMERLKKLLKQNDKDMSKDSLQMDEDFKQIKKLNHNNKDLHKEIKRLEHFQKDLRKKLKKKEDQTKKDHITQKQSQTKEIISVLKENQEMEIVIKEKDEKISQLKISQAKLKSSMTEKQKTQDKKDQEIHKQRGQHEKDLKLLFAKDLEQTQRIKLQKQLIDEHKALAGENDSKIKSLTKKVEALTTTKTQRKKTKESKEVSKVQKTKKVVQVEKQVIKEVVQPREEESFQKSSQVKTPKKQRKQNKFNRKQKEGQEKELLELLAMSEYLQLCC